MSKKLIILALICLMFSIVSGDANINEENSTKNAENNYECSLEIPTTIKLPLFIRIFGKKPLKFIKKSISKILGKNFTYITKPSNRSHPTLRVEKIRKPDKSTSIFTTRDNSYSSFGRNELNGTETPTRKYVSWSRKLHQRDIMSYYRRFVYTPERITRPIKVRKYYTPGGSPFTLETTNHRHLLKTTLKINPSNGIRAFTTTAPVHESSYQINKFNENHNSHNSKRQRRCSVHSSSEFEEGYTYLLRKKRPEVTFDPYAYLTRLSKSPVFTGNYTPRRYTYSKYFTVDKNKNIKTITAATTTSINTKAALGSRPRTFFRNPPRIAITTSTSPKLIFRTSLRPWTRKYYTSTPRITTTVVKNEATSTRNQTRPTTRAQHYWINNWNFPIMSYYMHPVNHTFRTYQPPITTSSPSGLRMSKTTRAMYYLSQYWNKAYFTYYTNFDPPDESWHGFAQRLGYFPKATTRFKKIRMMPKRYRPEGFIDVFSLDSFVRDMNKRLRENQTYPPPHERDSISASVEDVSYWFFFNRSVTPDELNGITAWKKKPRPTMKPIPSYFFKESIVSRYYPPSREEDLKEKGRTTSKKFEKTYFTQKPTRSWTFQTFATPPPIVHTFAYRSSEKSVHIRTPIPTLPTNRETTASNIDPYGLLNKIIRYNIQLKQPNGSRAVDLAKSHPVHQLPRFLQLSATLSPKIMMYTDHAGKQLFTLLGKYHIHENNKTLECIRNPSEFLNPFKVVAPPPESGYYRIVQRHRIRNNDEIEKNPAQLRLETNDQKGRQKLLPNDPTVALEIRFYPVRTPATIKTWENYLESQKLKSSRTDLTMCSTSSKIH